MLLPLLTLPECLQSLIGSWLTAREATLSPLVREPAFVAGVVSLRLQRHDGRLLSLGLFRGLRRLEICSVMCTDTTAGCTLFVENLRGLTRLSCLRLETLALHIKIRLDPRRNDLSYDDSHMVAATDNLLHIARDDNNNNNKNRYWFPHLSSLCIVENEQDSDGDKESEFPTNYIVDESLMGRREPHGFVCIVASTLVFVRRCIAESPNLQLQQQHIKLGLMSLRDNPLVSRNSRKTFEWLGLGAKNNNNSNNLTTAAAATAVQAHMVSTLRSIHHNPRTFSL